MTFEKKCLVEPSDIVAVHFECDNCHAVVVVPINAGVSSYATNTGGASCRFCQQAWNIAPNAAEHKVIIQFAASLEKLAANMNGRHLKLRMEIKCPE